MELDDCRLKIDHLSRVNESLTKIVQGSESGPLRDLTISEIEKTT